MLEEDESKVKLERSMRYRFLILVVGELASVTSFTKLLAELWTPSIPWPASAPWTS